MKTIYFKSVQIYIVLICVSLVLFGVLQRNAAAEQIPADRILTNAEILQYLAPDISGLEAVYENIESGDEPAALQELMTYLQERASERYYFSWKNFDERFALYRKIYPDEEKKQMKSARTHLAEFAADTEWKLPFKNLRGEDVSAYQLRHLARQSRASDMALSYYYSPEFRENKKYILTQTADLNRAFSENQYEKDGNAVYEVFRAGKRIHQWLFCSAAFMASGEWRVEDQLLMVKTFLHHGAQLFERTEKFRYGNHHTKGLTALFEISAMFPEFEGVKEWRERAIAGLQWHMAREINPDGFQFERSVHYHIGDIENYLRVFQLARRSNIELPQNFVIQFENLFHALLKIEQPNKKLPVLQDDTDERFSEWNELDGVMAIGSILFKNDNYGYFTGGRLSSGMYWLFNATEIDLAKSLAAHPPQTGSVALDSTGYYVMRGGWAPDDLYLIISAGLSREKPDHQHGDMLGISAYAHGNQVLPNYQVKYNYPDLKYWKNSLVKNVALVDGILQGRRWRPNSGGSGFGKWGILPRPSTLSWQVTPDFDFYAGTHDGYDSLGVKYFRSVFHLKNKFWVVMDDFISGETHRYQQVWQGHFKKTDGNRIQRRFDNGAVLDILQVNNFGGDILRNEYLGKGNAIFESKSAQNHQFVTLLLPATENQSDSVAPGDWRDLRNGWKYKNNGASGEKVNGIKTDAGHLFMSGEKQLLLLNCARVELFGRGLKFLEKTNVWLSEKGGVYRLHILGYKEVNLQADSHLSVKIEKTDGRIPFAPVVSLESGDILYITEKIIKEN